MRFGCDVSEERGAELDSTRISVLATMALIHKGTSVLPSHTAAERSAGEPCRLLGKAFLPAPSLLPWKLVASYTGLELYKILLQ